MSDDLALPCPCGRYVQVTAGQAGTNVRCECGTTLPVPKLADLRRLAGKDPYATNPAERIAKMERAGQLVLPDQCVACYMRTEGVLECIAVCEKKHTEVQADTSLASRLFMILSPVLYLLVKLFVPPADSEIKIHGHEVQAMLRLRLCANCRPSSSHFISRDTLVTWLRTVPIYAELLDLYPEAEITPRI